MRKIKTVRKREQLCRNRRQENGRRFRKINEAQNDNVYTDILSRKDIKTLSSANIEVRQTDKQAGGQTGMLTQATKETEMPQITKKNRET